MKKTTMKKAIMKIKAPNMHAMVFAAIIIAMFFAFMSIETSMYKDISDSRWRNAWNLMRGDTEFCDIEREAEQCAQNLKELSNRSPLGHLLAKYDGSQLGRVGNYFIVYGSGWVVIYCVFYIIWNAVKFVIFLTRKSGKFSRIHKEPMPLGNQ